MRVLLVSDLYLPIINGVVTSTAILAGSLSARGHEVRVLSLSQMGKTNVQGTTYYNSAFSIDKIYPNSYASFNFDAQIFHDICAWKPDIIHTQSEFSTYTFAKKIAKKLNVPMVHTYHTFYEDYTHYLFIPKVIAKPLVAFWLRKLMTPVSDIIVPTEKIKTALEDYNIKQSLHIIPTGIDLNFPILADDEKKSLKTSLDISDDKKIFISLGRVAKEKGIEQILDYLSQMNSDKWILIIAGDGPNKKNLERLVNELNLEDKVRFTGMIARDKIYKYYQVADIFVSASTSETQGLTYIEALANGIPLLCRYDTCLDNVLIPEKTGYFFNNYEDFSKYAEKLVEESLNSENMKKEIKLVADNYSKERFAEQVEEIYKKIICLS